MQDLILRAVDFTEASDWSYKEVPKRLAYLSDKVEGSSVQDPTFTAYQRLKALHTYKPLVYTDMYRSAAGSVKAYCDPNKKGVQKPGYSGHNFGVSIDCDINASMKRHKLLYNDLIHLLIAFGFTPYQGVSKTGLYARGSEDWHVNFISDFGYRPWQPGSPERGFQAISWINGNIKFDNDSESIQNMLHLLKHNTLDDFKNSLPEKLHNSSDQTVLIRMLNIMTCKVLDQNGNIIPG